MLLGTTKFKKFDILNLINESIFRSFTQLPCLGDLENPDQLPVLQVLKDTDDWVLWISVNFSFHTFLWSMNPFLVVSQNP